MSNDYFPILTIPAVPHEGGIRFLHHQHQIDITASNATTNNVEMIWKVLKHCNGFNTIQVIAELSGLASAYTEAVITELAELGVVTDAREQYLHFHRISTYPAIFAQQLTRKEIYDHLCSPRVEVKKGNILPFGKDTHSALSQIRAKRRSCREFADKPMSLDQIGNICYLAYSIERHAVPSGGALYPLKIYVLVEKDQTEMPAGYYEYDAENDCLISFKCEVDIEQLKYCFNQEEMPFGSSVQIVIAADLKRQGYKYGNRGYRLTLLEAGHAAQNIGLYCAENGLAACELGGILDEPLMRELEIHKEEIWPLLAMAVGYAADKKEAHNTKRKSKEEPKIHEAKPKDYSGENEPELDKILYVEQHVGEDKPVKQVWANAFGEHGAFFGATSVLLDGEGHVQYAGATSPSYTDAIFKAAIEGYERFVSTQVRTDYFGTVEKIPAKWLHPYDVFPLTPEQVAKCGLMYFTDQTSISWTKGVDHTGQPIFVPSDIVYYWHKTKGMQIYSGHSSGIAAYSNFAEAEKRALTELIERDALMRNWYTSSLPTVIGDGVLPIHVQKRITHWQKYGRQLYVLNIPSDYGTVFEAVIVSEEYPCFISGAAAVMIGSQPGSPAMEQAIQKAVQEAEYNLLLCLKFPNTTEMEPAKVLTPADHGAVYHSKRYAETLRWLWSQPVVWKLPAAKSDSMAELRKKLELITVDMSLKGSDLPVVRVFSRKLVQINFGYHSAHYSYPFLEGQVRPESLRMPHYFA